MFADATIVFDPDGTLVDTAPDLTNALNDVLTRRGLEPVAIEAIRGEGRSRLLRCSEGLPARRRTSLGHQRDGSEEQNGPQSAQRRIQQYGMVRVHCFSGSGTSSD